MEEALLGPFQPKILGFFPVKKVVLKKNCSISSRKRVGNSDAFSNSPKRSCQQGIRLVKFPNPEDEDGPTTDVEEIKRQVRLAIKALEEGKQVAAFNLLKRIVDS